MRFSSSNGLGDVVVVGHPEQPGEVGAGGNPLGGEGGDPEEREPLGFVSQPCRMWESCDLFLPGLGCHWPRLRGEGKCLPYWVRFSPLFPLLFHFGGARGFFRWHGSGATSRQLDLLDHEATCISCPKDGPSQPRFGKSGCGRLMVSLRFWGIPHLVGLPLLAFGGFLGG